MRLSSSLNPPPPAEQTARFLNKRLVPDNSCPEIVPSLRACIQTSTSSLGRVPTEILVQIEEMVHHKITFTRADVVASFDMTVCNNPTGLSEAGHRIQSPPQPSRVPPPPSSSPCLPGAFRACTLGQASARNDVSSPSASSASAPKATRRIDSAPAPSTLPSPSDQVPRPTPDQSPTSSSDGDANRREGFGQRMRLFNFPPPKLVLDFGWMRGCLSGDLLFVKLRMGARWGKRVQGRSGTMRIVILYWGHRYRGKLLRRKYKENYRAAFVISISTQSCKSSVS